MKGYRGTKKIAVREIKWFPLHSVINIFIFSTDIDNDLFEVCQDSEKFIIVPSIVERIM